MKNILKRLWSKIRYRQMDIFDLFKVLGIIFYGLGLAIMISCFFI